MLMGYTFVSILRIFNDKIQNSNNDAEELVPILDGKYFTKSSQGIITRQRTSSQFDETLAHPPSSPGHFNHESQSLVSNEHNFKNIENSLYAEIPSILPDSFYSKLFQYALKPNKILPFYFRATHKPESDDISITTLITIERLSVLKDLADKYMSLISCTLHISVDDWNENDDYSDGNNGNYGELEIRNNQQILNSLQILHKFRKANPNFEKYVDLHVIIDRFDRQFNLWRNIARLFARTELILTMDVDFMLCTDLKSNIETSINNDLKKSIRAGKSVLVIPAFEFDKRSPASELDWKFFPKTKRELHPFINAGQIDMFHSKWKRGHGPTDYERWYSADAAYRIEEYNYNYEPYILMKRDGLPWCDERFVGYGSNKAACLYEIFLAGIEFWVSPNDFLIHQRHAYPENDRRIERKYNKRLYDSYREETCVRYSRMFQGVPSDKSLEKEETETEKENLNSESSIGDAPTYYGVDERICGINMMNFEGL